MTFVILVLGVNYVVDQYGRGALRDAVDEGARAGARFGAPPDACKIRAEETINNLLGGKLGAGVKPVSCTTDGNNMIATVQATFPGWIPAVPAWTFTVRGEAHLETP